MKYLQIEHRPRKKKRTVTTRFWIVVTLVILIIIIFMANYTPVRGFISGRARPTTAYWQRVFYDI